MSSGPCLPHLSPPPPPPVNNIWEEKRKEKEKGWRTHAVRCGCKLRAPRLQLPIYTGRRSIAHPRGPWLSPPSGPPHKLQPSLGLPPPAPLKNKSGAHARCRMVASSPLQVLICHLAYSSISEPNDVSAERAAPGQPRGPAGGARAASIIFLSSPVRRCR